MKNSKQTASRKRNGQAKRQQLKAKIHSNKKSQVKTDCKDTKDKDVAQANLRALENAAIQKPAKISEASMPPKFFYMAMSIASLSGSKISFAAAGLYVVICNLLSRFFTVQIANLHGLYSIEINLSGLIVGEPSTNKSPVIKKILEHFRELIRQANLHGSEKTLFEIEKEKAQYKQGKKTLELSQKIRTEDPKRAMELEAEAQLLMAPSEKVEQQWKNFIISKCSLASLVRKVSKTNDPLLMVHEEAGDLLKLTQKAGDSTKEFYIGLMDGDSIENYENAHHEFNTSGKRLSILGAVQPEVISKIVLSVNDGLIQRFPIIAFENTSSQQEITLDNSQISNYVKKWNKLLIKLTQHSGQRIEIKLTDAAQQELNSLKKQFEIRINDRKTHPILKGLFGKRPSFIASIAAANAFIRNRGFEKLKIMREDVKIAAAYAELNEEHFEIAFGFNEVTQEKRALELLNRIMISKYAKVRFTASQVAKNEWSGFEKSAFVEKLLEILQKYQLAQTLQTDADKVGRPTVYWKINKDLLES